MHSYRWVGSAIIGCAAALVQIFAAARPTNPLTWDSPSYIEPAHMLVCCGRFSGHDPISYSAEAGSFPEGPLRAETIRTPVYPLLLAATFALGGDVQEVVTFQRVLVVLFAMALFLSVDAELGTATATVAAIVYVMWPAVRDVASVVMTETVASILIAVAVALFCRAVRSRRVTLFAAAGLVFGIATLTRPIVLYLPILLLAELAALAVPRRAIVVFALTAALLPIAWATRNDVRAGAFVVSSIEGENLLMFRAAGVLTVRRMPAGDAIFALQRQFGYYHDAIRMRPDLARQAIALATRDGIAPAALTHAVLSKYYGRLAVQTILAHPLAYAELATSSFIELYFEPLATRAAADGMNAADATLRFVPLAIAVFGLAVFGLARLHAVRRDIAVTLTVVLCYFTFVSAGPEVVERFLVPFMPVYATVVAVGVVELSRRVSAAARS